MEVLINRVEYEEKKTDSITNIGLNVPIYQDIKKLKRYHKLWPFSEYNSKKVFKELFGKQLICVNYTHRNWVWTFCNKENSACLQVLCGEDGQHWEYRIESDKKTLERIIKWVVENLLKEKEYARNGFVI